MEEETIYREQAQENPEAQWVYGHRGTESIETSDRITFADRFALLVPNSPVDWVIFALLLCFATIFGLYLKHEWDEDQAEKEKQKLAQEELLEKEKQKVLDADMDGDFFLPG